MPIFSNLNAGTPTRSLAKKLCSHIVDGLPHSPTELASVIE